MGLVLDHVSLHKPVSAWYGLTRTIGTSGATLYPIIERLYTFHLTDDGTANGPLNEKGLPVTLESYQLKGVNVSGYRKDFTGKVESQILRSGNADTTSCKTVLAAYKSGKSHSGIWYGNNVGSLCCLYINYGTKMVISQGINSLINCK